MLFSVPLLLRVTQLSPQSPFALTAIGLALTLAVASPVHAQRDISGNWTALYHEDQPHRIPGPELGDYTGIPLNDAGRLKADSWDASILTLREHQAKPHPSTYSLRGPGQHPHHATARSGHASRPSATSCSGRSAKRRA